MSQQHVHADGGGAMFDAIAPRYDRLNRLMSFGQDARWRRALVASLRAVEPLERVLDVATGTGDVLLALRRAYPHARLVGLDPSGEMLQRAAEKVGDVSRVELVRGDAQDLPFNDGAFDAVTIAFGLRNVPDRLRALREMRRVLRPGGALAVLELTEPRGLLAPAARWHIHRVVPKLGAWLSRGEAYHYLSQSIAAFPPAEEMVGLMRAAGLDEVLARPASFGAVHHFVGTRL